MMGLAYLLTFIVYLLISTAVIVVAVKAAKKRGKSAKLWGGIAALVMYNLVFWDFLPTLAVHQFYCMKDSGFWVYKTAEEWRKENPDVVVGPVKPPEGMVLDSNGNGVMYTPDGTRLVFHTYRDGEKSLRFHNSDGSEGYWLNERFKSIGSRKVTLLPTVGISTQVIQDSLTNDIFVKRVMIGTGPVKDIRIWLNIDTCGPVSGTGAVWKSFENLKNRKNRGHKKIGDRPQ